MLETIISFFATIIGELLESIVTVFLQYLSLDLNMFVTAFPFLAITYKVFQSVALGLVLCITLWQLSKFFFGQLTETKDTPVRILLRGAFAAALIFFGGHFLAMVVDLARTPYDVLVSDIQSNTWNMGGHGVNWGDALGITAVSGAAAIAFGLIIIALIAWNVLKLMLEVTERFVLVGVLVYTAPLAFSTVSSESSSAIFKKWCSMFFGQCVLMLLSVWSLKVVMSGFQYNENMEGFGFAMRFVMTLAFCKVAQRMDSYLQQLGINVGTTGGNLLEDIAGMGMMFKSLGGGKGGGGSNKTGVLGSSSGPVGGVLGGLSSAFKKGAAVFKGGGSAKSVFSSAASAYADSGAGPISSAVKAGMASAKEGASGKTVAAQAAKGVVKGLALGTIAGPIIGGQAARAERAAAMKEKKANTDELMRARSQKFQSHNNSVGGESFSKTFQDSAKIEGLSPKDYAQRNLNAFGAGSIVREEAEGFDAKLDDNAINSGLTWANNSYFAEEDNKPANQIKGPDISVGEHMAANYGNAATYEDYQKAMVETAYHGSPVAAEAALMNPNYGLAGNDELGSALLTNAFGDSITDSYTQGAMFHNVSAQTNTNGGRVVTAQYENSNGKVREMQILDGVEYNTIPANEQAQVTPYVANSGETYYVRSKTLNKPETEKFREAQRAPKVKAVEDVDETGAIESKENAPA